MPPPPLPQEEDIYEEDSKMSMLEESSDGEHEDDNEGSGQGDDNEQHTGDSGSDGQAQNGDSNNSSLPPSLLPPHLPSNSSDTEDDLPSLCQPAWTSNKGKAGFGVKPSHMKLNEANLFHLWYWAMQLKPDGAKRDAINDIITKEYNSLIKDIPKDETACPPTVSYWGSSLTVHQAKAWSNLKEMEIVGVVMYIGQDPTGHQTSGIFRGSDVTSTLPYSSKNCRVFGSMMKEKLVVALKDLHVTQGIEAGDPQKIVWQCLLEFMTKNYLIILNWPHGVSLPGPGFEYKKLKANSLRKLMDEEQDSLDGVLPVEIEIRPWNQDVIHMSESSCLKGEIPLVKAADVLNDDMMAVHTEDQATSCSNTQNASPIQGGCRDLHRDVPNHANTREHSSSQPLPQHYEDSHHKHANYHNPSPPNVPYNAMPPHHNVRPHFPPPQQLYHHIPSHPDHHIYHDGPYIDDYYPAAHPTPQHWGNRDNTMQYEDEISGGYVEDGY
ncbi:hypothetical protein F5141DRAFT_1059935 [Pisolithus sp. B1]|nr:hypothetical protein F5141DRAFT_1059935 [Pisolithus sp. B1]